MFFLLKLLFLPIWLPLKIIGELIEHSGRGHRSHRSYSSQPRTNSQPRTRGSGCGAVVLVVLVVAAIGAIANACSGPAQRAGHKPSASSTPTVSPTATPRTAARHARHHPRHRHRRHQHATAVPVATQSAPPSPSCYPLSNEGTCYEPGEFCRYSDEGATGVAGDSERIKCEDNNGWRWEPV